MQKNQTPPPTSNELNDSDLTEYTISVSIPDEIRTRDASVGQIGESGLYEFPQRTIDKLDYYYYLDGKFQETKSVLRTDNNPFSFTLRVTGEPDPSKISLLFVAYNKNDGSHNFNINTRNGTIETNTSESYSNNQDFYDSFIGYFPLSKDNDKSLSSVSFTLKRPYAEIHVLTDDFQPSESKLYTFYSNGVEVYAGFTQDIYKSGSYSLLKSPIFYNYIEKEISQNNVNRNFILKNNLQNEDNPFRVQYKNRTYDYIALFHILAPTEDTDPFFSIYQYLSFLVTGKGQNNYYFSLKAPEGGFKANHKYIIYDKPRSEGGSGFMSAEYTDYNITVIEDADWETPTEESGVDPEK